jgi:hypothetical protein
MTDLLVEAGLGVVDDVPVSDEGPWSDDELARLALAADPDAPLPDDAVPFELPGARVGPLPSWYMAPVVRSHRSRKHRIVVGALVAAFLTIDVFGLCATYGPLVLA